MDNIAPVRYEAMRPGRQSFIYMWTHDDGWFYIGKHRGSPEDGYLCGNRYVCRLIKQTTGWARHILLIADEADAYRYETRLIRKHAKNVRCLNRKMSQLVDVFAPLHKTFSGKKDRLTYRLTGL